MCGQYLANIQELNVINQFHSVFWCRHQSTSHDCHDNLKGSFRIFSPCFPSTKIHDCWRAFGSHKSIFPEVFFFSEQNRIAISSCHFLWNPHLKRKRFYFHRIVHLDSNGLFLTRPAWGLSMSLWPDVQEPRRWDPKIIKHGRSWCLKWCFIGAASEKTHLPNRTTSSWDKNWSK